MAHVYLIEDDASIRHALKALLELNGYTASVAESVEEASADAALRRADLVVADLRLPGAPGTEILRVVPDTPVLILTAYASVRSAVDSMKRGAVDYIAKPFGHDELLEAIARVLAEGRRAPPEETSAPAVVEETVHGMVGTSEAMREVYRRIDRVAATDTTVLILGESGTGKELVARALHDASRRREAAMIVVNCAAIPGELIESELFGHERGAFTGATQSREGLVGAADRGTLFLDEIGELPHAAQARLLRVLQEGEVRRVGSTASRRVDVRLIAATHRDLPELVRSGEFREDLYFRLHVMEIVVPPLRDRGRDLRLLAGTMLRRHCERLGRPALAFDDDALAAVEAHRWPGNVRELENAIERAVILCEGPALTADLVVPSARGPAVIATQEVGSEDSLESYFRAFVEANQASLSETELAERLGISRKTLWDRRRRFGIPREKPGSR